MSDELTVSVEDGIGLLELCRPPNNHVDEALIGQLADAAAGLDDDPGCRVIVLASRCRARRWAAASGWPAR